MTVLIDFPNWACPTAKDLGIEPQRVLYMVFYMRQSFSRRQWSEIDIGIC